MFTLPQFVRFGAASLAICFTTTNARADIIIGTSASETLHGSSGDDTIIGGGGADTLFGNGGDDTIVGGEESVGAYGGDGNDTLTGGGSSDGLNGGDGEDTIDGGGGGDNLYGGAGEDWIEDSAGDDTDVASDNNGPGGPSDGDMDVIDVEDGDDMDQVWCGPEDIVFADPGDWIYVVSDRGFLLFEGTYQAYQREDF